ncbi:MAG: FkbM family methyltransferase [Lachnospiraceae bacterium]|nr:FkbM family methyltransferase [Lachnospiraceae bacterium]
MLKLVKKLINKTVLLLMRKRAFKNYITKICHVFFLNGLSYSQNCEDLVLQNIMKNKKNGYYLDIGAHDPIRFSNTYQLYLNGWNGINIDPLPGCMKKFKKFRPGDININIGISSKPGEIQYYNFEEPAYNTVDKSRAEFCISNGLSRLKETISIRVHTLNAVLDKYLNGRKIDFMNLDVESRELDVLKSNNWDKYRPTIIAMESLISADDGIDKVYEDDAIIYLINKGYKVVGKVATEIFLEDWRQKNY